MGPLWLTQWVRTQDVAALPGDLKLTAVQWQLGGIAAFAVTFRLFCTVHLLCNVKSTVRFALRVHWWALGEHHFLTSPSSAPTSRAALKTIAKTLPVKVRNCLTRQRVSRLEQKSGPTTSQAALLVALSCYELNRITQSLSVTWEWITVFWGVIIIISQGTFVNTGNSTAVQLEKDNTSSSHWSPNLPLFYCCKPADIILACCVTKHSALGTLPWGGHSLKL